MMPLDALAKERGYKTAYSEKITGDKPEDLPPTFIGQRVCKDGPSQVWFNVAVRKERPRMVYEVDDDLWNIDISNEGAFKWFIKGIDDTGNYHDVHANLRRNISVADYVTCTTEPLAKILRLYNDNVHIIPNYIPRWLTEWERPRRESLTIGWPASGTHNMDWAYEGPHISRYLKRSGTHFRFIGADVHTARQQLGINLPNVSGQPWAQNVEDYWKSLDLDIMVIPLKPHVFNQSKSSIKFLEAAALGIPVVASDVGPYSRDIEHGKTGFLVRQSHEWARYLRDLVNDEAMREEIGNNAKAWAKTQVLEDHIDEWARVLFK